MDENIEQEVNNNGEGQNQEVAQDVFEEQDFEVGPEVNDELVDVKPEFQEIVNEPFDEASDDGKK
jgi:hypothetical protein